MRKYLISVKEKFLIGLVVIVFLVASYQLLEKDWLEIQEVVHQQTLYADNNILVFERVVNASKDKKVIIQGKLIDINSNAQYILRDVRYTPDKSNNGKISTYYIDIPLSIPNGSYVYAPTAIYDINGIKNVVKKLPLIEFVIRDR